MTGNTPAASDRQQGSIRLLTGSAGTTTGSITFDAYGNKVESTGTISPLGYDGQYTSSDTGLIYMRARVYDPATAQFLSVDPLRAITRALYTYVKDNPLNFVDPSGLAWQVCVGGTVTFGFFTVEANASYADTPPPEGLALSAGAAGVPDLPGWSGGLWVLYRGSECVLRKYARWRRSGAFRWGCWRSRFRRKRPCRGGRQQCSDAW